MAEEQVNNETTKPEVEKVETRGRKTLYKFEYCQQLIDYFDIEPYEEIDIPHYYDDGVTIKWHDKKRMPARLPTLRRFAKSIGVGISTIYDWLNEKHASFQKDFSDTFTQAQEIRKEFLTENALQGMYQPNTFKFIAVNITDMRDRTATEITGANGAPIPLQIVNFAGIDKNAKGPS